MTQYISIRLNIFQSDSMLFNLTIAHPVCTGRDSGYQSAVSWGQEDQGAERGAHYLPPRGVRGR